MGRRNQKDRRGFQQAAGFRKLHIDQSQMIVFAVESQERGITQLDQFRTQRLNGLLKRRLRSLSGDDSHAAAPNVHKFTRLQFWQ